MMYQHDDWPSGKGLGQHPFKLRFEFLVYTNSLDFVHKFLLWPCRMDYFDEIIDFLVPMTSFSILRMCSNHISLLLRK